MAVTEATLICSKPLAGGKQFNAPNSKNESFRWTLNSGLLKARCVRFAVADFMAVKV